MVLSQTLLAQTPQDLSREEVKSVLAQAKQLVIARDMEQAYALLSPLELQLAGDSNYDYLLGTAAVDSGHADLAIFALERVLEEKPRFAGARIELARAYFEVGDTEQARYHFDYLIGQNPPANVQSVITSYLRAIDRLAAAYKTIHIPHFATGFGYDDNANASTNVEQFLGFILDGNNTETKSSYYFATVGDYYSRPLSPDWKLIVSGALNQRIYPSAHFVDSSNVYATVGFEWSDGDTKVLSTFGASHNWLDFDSNMGSTFADVSISHSLNDDWKLLGGVTAAANRFTSDLEVRDADIYNAKFGVEHYLDAATGSVISFTAMLGTDNVKNSNSPYENDRWAVALSASRIIGVKTLLGIDLGYKNTDYDGKVDFFGNDREDDEFKAAISLHRFDWPYYGWRTTARLAYTDVDSDIDLYTYDRTEIGLTFHRSFE